MILMVVGGAQSSRELVVIESCFSVGEPAQMVRILVYSAVNKCCKFMKHFSILENPESMMVQAEEKCVEHCSHILINAM